ARSSYNFSGELPPDNATLKTPRAAIASADAITKKSATAGISSSSFLNTSILMFPRLVSNRQIKPMKAVACNQCIRILRPPRIRRVVREIDALPRLPRLENRHQQIPRCFYLVGTHK